MLCLRFNRADDKFQFAIWLITFQFRRLIGSLVIFAGALHHS